MQKLLNARTRLALAFTLLFCTGATAGIVTSAPPLKDNASVAERAVADAVYASNASRWLTAVAACKAKSPAFKKLMEGYTESGRTNHTPGIEDDTSVSIDVQLVNSGDFIDAAEKRGGNGQITVNVDNLMRLPDPDIVSKRPSPGLKPVPMLDPPPGEAWGMTRCELIAHVLREAKEMNKQHVASLSEHRGPHDDGRESQNDVRGDFHQGGGELCKSSRLPKDSDDPGKKVAPLTITYKKPDGTEATVTPGNQVQIQYGGDNIEVLWYDDAHKLQIAFFHGTTQVSRNDVVLPGDDPIVPPKPGQKPKPRKLNPDYVSTSPGTGASDESLGAFASCPPPPAPPPPVPAPSDCSSGGGLAGAMNGVACKIQHG